MREHRPGAGGDEPLMRLVRPECVVAGAGEVTVVRVRKERIIVNAIEPSHRFSLPRVPK
jgi:hypothetical protein